MGEPQEKCIQEIAFSIVTRYRVELVCEHEAPYDEPIDCSSPHLAASFLREQFLNRPQEVMGAVFLDTRHRAIGHIVSYRGTINRIAVEPRGLLVPALLAFARGIFLFHNHPSGDPTPSAEDIAFTRRLLKAGEVVGIQVVDHLILGEIPPYLSMKRLGHC